jgi:hydrogenase maturation protein HypF
VSLVRTRIRVEGIVQGVGFRPFVCGLAAEHGLAGFVGNDEAGVFIEAEGPLSIVDMFVGDLRRRAPVLAVIERLRTSRRRPTGQRGFRIVTSAGGGARRALVSPDMATCADCLAELWNPDDRRYRYPFINCTNCGPRFTILTDVPYDRAVTTMRDFPMCAECAYEYADPANRRFHAEPVCCPACGPSLRFLSAARADGRSASSRAGDLVDGDPLDAAAAWLRDGRVVAVKGLGGYHLAALADHEPAVAALRLRKHREEKPFAVMVADLAAARVLAHCDALALSTMDDPRRPVVLVRRREDAAIAPSVAPGNRQLGLMLPYTPLHHLLAAAVAAPFVLTSGNVSDEPIAYDDRDARDRLAAIADGFLVHDRRIHVRADDSVVRTFPGGLVPIRRSRGAAPAPVMLPDAVPRPVLACGAELKNTFCLAKGRHAFLSPHIGDLKNAETLRSYVEGIIHMRRLFDVAPQVVAHDLHPDYLSTAYARELDGVATVGVQHHHAHIAACLADNGYAGPVVGVAFDGLGFGIDGTIWGGELLVADLLDFRRVDHLTPVPMPGGPAAVREPWRMAAAYLDHVCGDDIHGLAVVRRQAARWADVVRLSRIGLASPSTSSAGRLFDAVAAIVGLRDAVTYEGQAAVELEQLAVPGCRDAYPVPAGTGLRGATGPLLRAVVDDVRRGVAAADVSTRFHNGLADATVAATRDAAAETGLDVVALSGGVFQNVVLLQRVLAGLAAAGLRALVHRQVPPNDGGLCLGQAAVAAARDRAGLVA